MILKRYVLHAWSLSSEHYVANPQLDFLPQEQKDHIRHAMMDLLMSDDNVIRDIAASIVPKIAQADWPNDWPGFLEGLSKVIAQSSDVTQIVSVLRVLRGINRHTFPFPTRKLGSHRHLSMSVFTALGFRTETNLKNSFQRP
jgi:hypothetical protein